LTLDGQPGAPQIVEAECPGLRAAAVLNMLLHEPSLGEHSLALLAGDPESGKLQGDPQSGAYGDFSDHGVSPLMWWMTLVPTCFWVGLWGAGRSPAVFVSAIVFAAMPFPPDQVEPAFRSRLAMRLEGVRPEGFGRGFGAVQAGVTCGNSWARNTGAAKRSPQASRELVERPRICRKPAPPGATGCLSAAARKRLQALGGPEKQVQRRRGQ